MAGTQSEGNGRTWDLILVFGVGLILAVSGALLFAEVSMGFCLFQPGYVCGAAYNGAGSLAVFIFLVGVLVIVAGVIWASHLSNGREPTVKTR